ncbi:uncharacterized protein F4822DRAFT_436969 [Hypoxylon trugodes]|uniref:uncharacterized protein n=1 Tax=Hypoxylon trugodes TaxID=326681 RepID=UPI0021918CC8|nr:uncharacterized protein F4822DRAFT_436969 [Hypoxylon trugodes]KAI1389563.1 hypothetical protein F4822DRAFT_436969 [Hypoxylon trugodes]
MAFHQPTRQATQRVFRPASEDEESQHIPQPSSQPVEDSQTWVLFSPATDAGTSTSYLTSTNKTNTTLGRSRQSEIGSLNTIAPSDASTGQQQQQHSASLVDAADEDEDDAELDSLDSHLPEFRSNPNFYDPSHILPHTTPVVPAHDGLGSFRFEQEGIRADLQERLYAFEQYNPRRVRRRESLDLAQIELEDENDQEMDKMRRIEAWRLEQSRYLLEEIQKETRRRRRSVASMATPSKEEEKASEVASMSGVDDMSKDSVDQSWHDHDDNESETGRESVWGRITRKVIRDLMGIDDKLLAILFGEALPDEEDLSTTPKASAMSISQQSMDVTMENTTDSGWQLKMLERVAKELGSLIHRLSEHPGAFSTFSRVQQMPIPYAGLPPIPEGTNDTTVSAKTDGPSVTIPEFQPTIKPRSQPIDVPHVTHPLNSGQGNSQAPLEASGNAFTQDEWEQELDVRLVFRYLRSRFMSRPSSSGGVIGNSGLGSSSTQDIAAKAARVRQHHPLISRPRTAERRKSKATVPSSPVLFKHASSCASQSTRRSVRRSSCSSSRHYWDIGGSVGTGSLIATTGPMGSWGEV